jgi:predicted GNAT family N-acyltransferase
VAEPEIQVARIAEVSPETLFLILLRRVDVFVVEQQCAYRDLDGRDLEPDGWLVWAARSDGAVLATLRIVPSAARIGRVTTARSARSTGLAARLMRRALELTDAAGDDIVLDAQSPLRAWYERSGFVVSGEPFIEDGIPHVPMTRRHGGVASERTGDHRGLAAAEPLERLDRVVRCPNFHVNVEVGEDVTRPAAVQPRMRSAHVASASSE